MSQDQRHLMKLLQLLALGIYWMIIRISKKARDTVENAKLKLNEYQALALKVTSHSTTNLPLFIRFRKAFYYMKNKTLENYIYFIKNGTKDLY